MAACWTGIFSFNLMTISTETKKMFTDKRKFYLFTSLFHLCCKINVFINTGSRYIHTETLYTINVIQLALLLEH